MGIKPLPNLEFKFVCADTLVGLPKEEHSQGSFNFGKDSFFVELEEHIGQYFSACDPADKKELREKIETVINKKVNEKNESLSNLKKHDTDNRYHKYFEKKNKVMIEANTYERTLWDSYKNIFRNKKVEFFEIPYFFPEVNKFDIVIANPPYIRQETFKDKKDYLKKNYQVYNGIADLYVYFFEKGLSLLKNDGIFIFIVANKWMRTSYGKQLRNYLAQRKVKKIIDFGDLPVFKNTSTYPCIIKIQNSMEPGIVKAANIDTLSFNNFESYIKNMFFVLNPDSLSDSNWNLTDQNNQQLLIKIKGKGIPLETYVDKKVFYGIKTGLNKAFVIDEATKARLIAEDKKSAEIIKPFVLGRDIKKYK
jgi:hypothetical protein